LGRTIGAGFPDLAAGAAGGFAGSGGGGGPAAGVQGAGLAVVERVITAFCAAAAVLAVAP
jgi:hypothetical protein